MFDTFDFAGFLQVIASK